MVYNYKLKKFMSQICSMVLLLTFFIVNIFVAQVDATPPPAEPGQSGFIALSQYLNPTDIPNVYKVMLTIEPTSKPTLTDIVIVINEGHDASRRAVLSDSNSLPTAPFGYKLNINGEPTTTPRRWGASGYTIYDAELFSAEQIIRKLADPTINPNYQNTRIAMVSYGAGGSQYKVINRSGLVSLADPTNVKFLLSKIGILDQATYITGTNPVPLAKSTQQAYQILENSGVPLFFTFPSPGFTVNDNELSYPDGSVTAGNLTTGTWQPPDGTTIDDFNSINKHIVSLHCIGASMPNQSNGLSYTLYPLTVPSAPTNIQNNAATALPSNQQETKYDFPAYDAARYVIKTVSDKLQGAQTEKVFHSFTFWVDPNNLNDKNSYAWLDFNQTISAFPLSATPLIPGSGYTAPSPTRKAMLYNTYVAPSNSPYFSYENWEGVQYWSDTAQTHNIRDYSDFNPEISSLVEQFSSYAKDVVVKGVIQDHFEIYDYPGEERFSIYVSDDADPPHDGGTVEYKNKTLIWDIGSLPQKGTLILSFYVSFDVTDTSSDLSYLFSNTKLEYNFGQGLQEKFFPNVYIKGSHVVNDDNTVSFESNNSLIDAAQDNNVNSFSSDTEIVGINIFNTPMLPYTASVTPAPKPTKIIDETIDEETIEIPITGALRLPLILVVIVIATSSIFIIRKSKQK